MLQNNTALPTQVRQTYYWRHHSFALVWDVRCNWQAVKRYFTYHKRRGWTERYNQWRNYQQIISAMKVHATQIRIYHTIQRTYQDTCIQLTFSKWTLICIQNELCVHVYCVFRPSIWSFYTVRSHSHIEFIQRLKSCLKPQLVQHIHDCIIKRSLWMYCSIAVINSHTSIDSYLTENTYLSCLSARL